MNKKFLLFKKLIEKTFPSYQKKYSINSINKKIVVKFILSDPDRLINLTIWPDSEWHEFKKEIKFNIISPTFSECFICFYQKLNIINCEKCSFAVCDDCISEIAITNSMYRCPNCRYIPPHLVCINDTSLIPYFICWRKYYWLETNVRPPENYFFPFCRFYDELLYVTDDWIKEIKDSDDYNILLQYEYKKMDLIQFD